MADTNPVTKTDLLKSVSKSLAAQQQLRDRMGQVAADVAAGKAAPPGKGSGQ